MLKSVYIGSVGQHVEQPLPLFETMIKQVIICYRPELIGPPFFFLPELSWIVVGGTKTAENGKSNRS